jgi:hypothetical protein
MVWCPSHKVIQSKYLENYCSSVYSNSGYHLGMQVGTQWVVVGQTTSLFVILAL